MYWPEPCLDATYANDVEEPLPWWRVNYGEEERIKVTFKARSPVASIVSKPAGNPGRVSHDIDSVEIRWKPC